MKVRYIWISRENKDYLIKGTELICDKGQYENKFEVSEKSVEIQGYSVANQTDNIAGKHIKSFGSCSVMGACKMETDLRGQFLIWHETLEGVVMCGGETLLEDSYCFCPYGGKVTVSDSKQIDYASAMAELFGDFAGTVEQMKEGIEDLSDMAVKSLIGMFDGAMTEYYTNEENRLRDSVRDMERNNTGNSYIYTQTGYNPREELVQLQRSKAIYEASNWQDIKNVNLKDVYAKMQENLNKVDLGPRKISGLMALTNPLFAAGYYIETKVRDIRSVLPDMTIGDFFSRGISKEGITELWTKGMDCQNKKMLPGMLGYQPLQAAYTAGYSNYDPMESMQIVDSMSDDGKAAYMLRKTANDGMSAYNEVYGYYQMSKALDMAGKGKVKTGAKEKVSAFGNMSPDEAKNYQQFWDDVASGKSVNQRMGLDEIKLKKVGKVAYEFETFDPDPAKTFYGPGTSTHPKEWNQTIENLKNEGVEIVKKDNGTLSYAPKNNFYNSQLNIDNDASYSALKHEGEHYLFDKSNGFPGNEFNYQPVNRIRSELGAYMQEIKMAEQLGNRKLANQLFENYVRERNQILFGIPKY